MVSVFVKHRSKFNSLLVQVRAMIEPEVVDGGRLFELIHSTKSRLKDEGHLREKILRKIRDGRKAGEPFDISEDNMFERITDLAAFRIMHLHPRQMEVIHPTLMKLFEERKMPLFEPPAARVWDLETEKFYKEVVGLETVHTTEKLYSSVHYVVRSNRTTQFTCEIQVRTLADEVWGEVDHSINYPVKSTSVACKEQIKSLAHLTTSCNRLADSIFASHLEWERLKAKAEHGEQPTQAAALPLVKDATLP
jgi:putative GTP pyrophosphokinase